VQHRSWITAIRISGIFFLIAFFISPFSIYAQEANKKKSVFRDTTDNAIDISDWLISKKGLLVIPTIITEPAVGYGAAAAAIYFHSSYTEKNGPPSMSGILGGGTQNGTWMGGIFHVGYWRQDRLRYMGAIVRTNANLGFYGSGRAGILENESVNLNLDAWVLLQQIKARIGKTNFFAGGKYLLLKTDNTFEVPVDLPEFNGIEFNSTLSEASVILNYDTRNNVFSPSNGFFIQLTGTYSDTWFGGDGLYGRFGVDAIGYFPASRKVMVGLRYGGNYTFGDVPFYARPMVQMRGVPLMKYQNKNTTLMETEVSVDLSKRWSIIGFAGIGNAYSSISEFDQGKSVRTLGSGFRYFLARKLGARMGMDFAASQDDFAFYFVFGSSWIR
jgi:hypothetical protein